MRRKLRHFPVSKYGRHKRFYFKRSPIVHMMAKPIQPVCVKSQENNRQSYRYPHNPFKPFPVIKHKQNISKSKQYQYIRSNCSKIRSASLHRIHTYKVINCIHLMNITTKSIKMVIDRNSFRKSIFWIVWSFQRYIPDRSACNTYFSIILYHLLQYWIFIFIKSLRRGIWTYISSFLIKIPNFISNFWNFICFSLFS